MYIDAEVILRNIQLSTTAVALHPRVLCQEVLYYACIRGWFYHRWQLRPVFSSSDGRHSGGSGNDNSLQVIIPAILL